MPRGGAGRWRARRAPLRTASARAGRAPIRAAERPSRWRPPSGGSHAWVEGHDDEVRDQVEQDHGRGREQEDTLEHGQIAVEQRVVGELPDAGHENTDSMKITPPTT